MSFLWGKLEPFINKDLGSRSVFDNLGATKLDVWRAVGREALLDNPENLLWNIGKIKYEQKFNDEKISELEFKRDYGDSGLEYDPNMTHEMASYLLRRKKEREINEYIVSRGKGGLIEATGSFGSAVLSSFVSPTNIALSLVPIGGQARWASFASKYGKLASTAAKGATSGAVFQAGFEPVVKYSRHLEQRPYTLEESITNIGISAVFGGMLNVGAYGVGRLREKVKDFSLEDIYIARKQLDAGRHIDLDFPGESKSIYETDRHPEILDIGEIQGEMQERTSPINLATDFISGHRSRKIGFKEFLRQTDLKTKTVSKELLCGFMADLEKADLTYAFKSKILGKSYYQDDIARELANLTTKEKPIGFTGSRAAMQIAQIVHKWQNIALTRAAKVGAHITPLDGYITRQMHSSKKISSMQYKGWRDFIVPLLDMDKTRAAYDGNIDFREIYNSLATGVHKVSSYDLNLSKQLNAERKLHFKSADHWMKYNEQCGEYNLTDSILLNLQSMGKSIALLDMLGDNPEMGFNSLKSNIIDSIKPLAADGNRYAVSDLKYLMSNKPDNIFDFIAGSSNPGSPSLAAIGQGIRAFKSMSCLGSVVISSIPYMATWVSELANHGTPILEGYRQLITNVVRNMVSSQRRDFARSLGIASESMLGFAYDRLGVDYPALGVISKMTNMFFKLNLMDWWDASFKSSMGMVLSNNLARKVNTAFSDLPSLLRQQLSRYGINESNWHLYANFKQRVNGNYYLVPDSRINENLADNLRRYFLDRVDISVPTPHSAEKSFSLWGTKAGTGVGEFARFFMQFKSFPIAYIMRPLNAASLERVATIRRTGIFTEDLKMALLEPGVIASMTHLLVGTSVFGYFAIAARNMLKGEDIPDPEDPRVWTASVIKGGGLGIFGDFLFNQYDRYGRTFIQELQGPVLADINSIASIIAKARDGRITEAEKESLRLFINNVPGRNLFYLLPAITMLEK